MKQNNIPFQWKNSCTVKPAHVSIFIMILLVLSVFGTSGRANTEETLCEIGINSDQDGDIDGADLQQFAMNLKNGTENFNALSDFARLFGTDDIDISLAKFPPTLAMMVATGEDTLMMAWTQGTDGETPADQVRYDIYLGASESFIPDSSTLVDTITGASQIEITGLRSGTLYYGKVIATYNSGTRCSSNSLQTKTYPFSILEDPNTEIALASDYGLGKYTTSDEFTYIYSSGTPPPVGSILFSENITGGMTIRRVDSTFVSGAEVTVITTDASLTDVLSRASNYTSFKLFDVAEETAAVEASGLGTVTSKSSVLKEGSAYNRMDWENGLLSVEQTSYAYKENTFSVRPQDGTSTVTFLSSKDLSSEFEADVSAKFDPKLITHADWGGTVFKHLDSAQVGAKGTLTLKAFAHYNFAAAGSVNKDFTLWKKTWTSVYSAGPVPVYQEVTLSMNVEANASASSEIKAMAEATFTETVELGAIYDGSRWTTYITHDENKSFSASLDIKGKANAKIKLVPKIEVSFYKIASASLSVEPYVGSDLTFSETTTNWDFLMKYPEYAIQLTSFDASVGIDAKVAASLHVLGMSWDVLPPKCLLGTSSDCLYTFNGWDLFSLPQLKLTANPNQLELQVTDGIHNAFDSSSVQWEVFPDDASIQTGSCSKEGEVTTCRAILIPGIEDEYTVFVSGQGEGILGAVGRQFIEMSVVPCCTHEGDYYIRTQEDIDAFKDIRRLNGNLFIESQTLSSLNGLENLRVIDGDLYIGGAEGNLLLENVDGLTGLVSLSGDLWVGGVGNVGNAKLKNINGLQNLTKFAGWIVIEKNPELQNIQGLIKVTTAWGIDIVDNDSLASLDGLDNLQSLRDPIGGGSLNEDDSFTEIMLWDNPSLTGIDALAGLRAVSNIDIGRNSALESLFGLHNIQQVDEVYVWENHSLQTMQGLNSLQSATWSVEMWENNGMTSLDGLENLRQVGYCLWVSDSPALVSATAVSEIFTSENLEIGFKNLPRLSELPAFKISAASFILIINCDALTDLSHLFDNVIQVDNFQLRENDALKKIETFENLTVVADNLEITQNSQLEDINILNKLARVGGSLTIKENQQLANLNGLIGLEEVGDGLWMNYDMLDISNNDSLNDVSGLGSLERINGNLNVSGNNQLASLHGFEKVKNIGGYFKISFNDKLVSLGFDALESVGDKFQIIYNPQLPIDLACDLENQITIGESSQIYGNKCIERDGTIVCSCE